MKIITHFATVSTLALVATLGVASMEQSGFVSVAWAQDDHAGDDGHESEGGQGQGSQGAGGQGQGGQGEGAHGAQSGQGNQGGDGAGQGGPDDDSDSNGPQAGSPRDNDNQGGKPAWAQEGIPEVELGRLSVARSPDQVLDRALAEAGATLTPEMVSFYNQSMDEIIYDLSMNWDTISIYDSPLQNLALFKDILEDGQTTLSGVNDSDYSKLLAVFLGVASDKTLVITEDTAVAILTILGEGLPTHILVDPATLAADAEAVRVAVLAGHG